MPAKSKSQQRLFGMLHAYNKGELRGSKSLLRKMKSMSRHISDEDARHFAETPHKDLPEKKAALGMGLNALGTYGLPQSMRESQIQEGSRFAKNLVRGADAGISGIGQFILSTPGALAGLMAGAPVTIGGLVSGDGLSAFENGFDVVDHVNSAVNNFSVGGASLGGLQKRLDNHVNGVVDEYIKDNDLDVNNGLDQAGIAGIRASNRAGQFIGLGGLGGKALKTLGLARKAQKTQQAAAAAEKASKLKGAWKLAPLSLGTLSAAADTSGDIERNSPPVDGVKIPESNETPALGTPDVLQPEPEQVTTPELPKVAQTPLEQRELSPVAKKALLLLALGGGALGAYGLYRMLKPKKKKKVIV